MTKATPVPGIIGIAVALVSVSFSFAQQIPLDQSVERTLKLLKAPETPAEYWDAVKFSLNVGKPDEATLYLKRLLESDPPAELLLMIRERDAVVYFPKLAAKPELQELAVDLLRKTEEAAQQKARDPARIQMFIRYLTQSAQHRSYGIAQLRKAGADAVPHLLQALRDPALAEWHATILYSIQQLDSSAVPPLEAALHAPDHAMVSYVIAALSVLGNSDTVPHLRYLAEAAEIPDAIKSQARSAIERILKTSYADLPAATEMITAQARKYYDHRVDLRASAAGLVRLWRWVPAEGLKSQDVSASYAEEYFGLGHCRQALVLDASYEPAQILLVSLALEKQAQRVGIDQALPEGPGEPSAAGLAAGTDLLLKVLRQAITDSRPEVIVSTLRLLSRVADANVLAAKRGEPSPVLDALAMPDRRIQFAAAEVVLGTRPQEPVPNASLVMTILAQSLAAEGPAKALVIDHDSRRGGELASFVRELGYDAWWVNSTREGFAQATASARVALIFLDPNIHSPEVSPTIASFRNDPRTSGIPIFVVGNAEPHLVNDPVHDALKRGDPAGAQQLLQEFGQKVVDSKLDAIDKASVQKQLDDSSRLLQRVATDIPVSPSSRMFMSLFRAELKRIEAAIMRARSNEGARSELLSAFEGLAARVDDVGQRLSGQRAAAIRAASYPGPRELEKFERRYPRVKMLIRPHSLAMLRMQLEPFVAALQAKPLTAAERADQARRAAAWLARIARGEIRGFDVRQAEPQILLVLGHDVLGPDAITVAGVISTADSQGALARLVRNESVNMPNRLEAAHQLAHSLRQFGPRITSEEIRGLDELFRGTQDKALYQALAGAMGALKPRAQETGERLRQLPTPAFQAVVPAADAAVPAAQPDPDAAQP